MSEHSGMICGKRTQDLRDGFQDDYCINCFLEDEELQRCYLEREECYAENAVTSEEFSNLKTCNAPQAYGIMAAPLEVYLHNRFLLNEEDAVLVAAMMRLNSVRLEEVTGVNMGVGMVTYRRKHGPDKLRILLLGAEGGD